MFKSLIKATLSVAVLPASIALDSMGAWAFREGESLTVDNVKNISKHVKDILE